MAFTQRDIDELDEAIAAGEKTVKVNGREVEYRSIDEMLKARRHIAGLVARGKGRRKSPLSGIRTVLDRGL
jgi:hypothetical protein